MAEATVITGIFGGYDSLKQPPEQDVDVEWFCVTDDPQLEGGRWKVWHQKPNALMHPRYAAKVPKCVPWRWVGRADHPVIWVDASFTFRNSRSVGALAELASRCHMMETLQFRHPNRNCIYAEANFSKALPKYVDQPIAEQGIAYYECNHPADWGLWATGLIVYPRWTWEGEARGMRWLTEQLTWTNQDQISQPHVWRLVSGYKPVDLPGGLIVNDFVELHPHRDGT